MVSKSIEVSDLVRKVIAQVSKSESKKSLIQFYVNAQRFSEISEMERELLIEAIEGRLRVVAPTAAKKVFGAKDESARAFLQRVFDSISSDFDLSDNRVKNGVKTGGHMISGECYVDVYTSYKNEEGWHATLGWLQRSLDDDPVIVVRKYLGGLSNHESLIEKSFCLERSSEAENLYRSMVSGLLGS